MTAQLMPRTSELDRAVHDRIRAHLAVLYAPDQVEPTLERLWWMMEQFVDRHGDRVRRRDALFDERDVTLITYADQISEPDKPPLTTLHDFLSDRVGGVISGVHLLPHYPATSDDGFAVADYNAVDPALGTWRDVRAIGDDFRLMLDAVINHVSARGTWVREWRRGAEPFEDFFIDLPPDTDTTSVTRPRTSPLLTPVETTRGVKWVWSTFSADQFDLNYANPEVMLAVCEVLLRYVASGASILRLDAVAFLWKQLGTSSIHLPQTHEAIRLWRTMFDAVAPGTLLLTETNVPHKENVSYFGSGDDEAHMVYQFPLAPLTLSAFHLADTLQLQEWLTTITTPSPQTTFFNFLGCHDGIGLRPAEGLLTPSEIQQLCDLGQAHGGGVSYRSHPDGSQSPYELNTVFFDALNPIGSTESSARMLERHLSAQSILLSLAGMPAIYVHALLGSRNWHDGVKRTKRLRTINRQKFDRAALEAELDDAGSMRHVTFRSLCERIAVRTREPAFHPSGPQRVVSSPPCFLAYERTSPDDSSRVLCVHNVTGRRQRFEASAADGLTVRGRLVDLIDPQRAAQVDQQGRLSMALEPYGVAWLRQTR
ncbi:MAG TPA: alpha-amylase family glycosyl hydrolase [Euzebyales bacterium]|nr:alpha-amylase family glycosyl hydrolase [Euzebyales bacterium]